MEFTILNICIAVIIICTLFLIGSFVYAEYWRKKVEKAKKQFREEG